MAETAVTSRLASPSKGIAVKLWAAARTEFSLSGYHGARVQGIARRAGCNVALLYRHWSSKKALYLELLKSVWVGQSEAIVRLLKEGHGAPAVVSAYLETLLADPEGAQIVVREYLDGGPFLSQLVASEPGLVEPVHRAVEALKSGNSAPLRASLDPPLVALTVGGLAALVSSAQGAARPFLEREVTLAEWRSHLSDLLLHGLIRGPATAIPSLNGASGDGTAPVCL